MAGYMDPDDTYSKVGGESGMTLKNENYGVQGHDPGGPRNAANKLPPPGMISGGRNALINGRTGIHGQGGRTVAKECLIDSRDGLINSKQYLIEKPASTRPTSQSSLQYTSRGNMFATIAVPVFLLSSIPVARAADSGDDFTNNLFSDLAPVLALFGEQVVKQFMSESSGWADNVLFAMAPLGVITGVVSAIRVAGHPWLKALVGRAKEGLAQAELELMSSNSPDVGEMWNGQAVVRVLGKPSIFQFIYSPDTIASGTASPSTVASDPPPQTPPQTPPGIPLQTLQGTPPQTPPGTQPQDTSSPSVPTVLDSPEAGGTAELDLTSKIDILSDSNAFFERRRAEPAPEQPSDRGHEWHDNIDIEMRPLLRLAGELADPQEISNEDNPPNISLNARGRLIGDREKWSMAALAVAAQLAVLIFDYLISYHPRLKTRFLKDGVSPSPQSFPCTIFGTVCLSLGMLVCSYVVDSASTEETWVLKDKTSNCKVAWIQMGGTVNDQEFSPYLIFGHQGQQKIRTSHRCHPRGQSKLRFWVLVSTCASIVGFVTQFIGLRGMNWAATIAQLAATAFVTALRSFARRRMSKEPIVSRAVKGYELDCMARKVSDCLGWKVISEIPYSIPAEQRDSFAHSVVLTRKRLGRLSGWPADVQDVANALCASMEQTLNYVHQTKNMKLRKSASESLEFRFTLAALALKEEHPPRSSHASTSPPLPTSSAPPATTSHHYTYLPFQFTRPSLVEQWRMSDDMREEISAVLSLWKLHSVEEESFYNKGYISPDGKDLDDIQRIAQVLPWPSLAVHRRAFGLWMGRHDIEVVRKHPQDISRDAASPIPIHRIIGTSRTGEDPHVAIHPSESVKKLFAQQIFSTFLSELLTFVSETTGPAGRNLDQWKLQGLHHGATSQLAGLISETGLGTREEIHMLLITHFGDHKLLPPQSHHERAREAHFRIERALRKSRLDNKWDLTASHILNLLSAYSAPQHSLTTIKRDNSVLLTILDDSPTSHMKVDEPDVACMARRFITRLASFLDPAEGNHLKRPNHSKALFLQWLRDIDLNTLNSLPSPAPVKEWELEDTPIIDALIGNANKYLDPKDSEKATILLEKFINFEKKGDLADPHCLTWEELKPLRRLMDSQDEAERVAIMKEATKCGYVSVLEALLDFSPSLQHPESNSLVIASARDGPTIYHFLTQLFWYFPPEYRQFQTTQQPMLLFKAVEIGDRHLTRELAKHSMPESADQYRQTCLILAAWNNHQIIVEDLLEDGAKVDGCVFGRYNKALLLTRFNHRDEWLRHEWITDSFTSYVNSSPKSTEVVKGPRPGSGAKGDYRGVVEEFLGTGNIPMAIAAISVRTALQAAAERGHLSMVRYLVEKKEANVNTGHYGQSWRSALQAAAGGGHLQVVEMLIKAGAQVNKPAWGYSGRTALQAAAEYGDLKVVDLLLGHNAKIIPTPTFSPDGGLSALAAAAKGGHLAVVDRLLERILVNGSLNPEEWDLGSALIAAAQGGHLAVVNGLIERNAPVGGSASMSFGRTALQAAAAGGNLQVLDRLLALDSDINAAGSGYGGRTALQAAAGGGHLAATNWLLERNADVDAPASDSDGRTALQAAAEGGHLAVVERLLERSADVNAAPAKDNGRTALQAAAGGGYPEDVDRVLKVVDLLLDRNADVNAPASDSGGRTALQAAAASGHLAIVERLLERSADVNAAPAKIRGRTALQAAAEGGHLAVVELLLARGADVNATPAEHSGRTALQAAAGNCHLAIVNLLLERGADVNATPAKDNGRTALQAAAQGGHLGVVDLLLEHNADVNAPANKFMGRTALQEAAENGHLAIAKRLLIEHNADINAARAEIEGVSALNAAQKGRYEDIYNVFTSFGAL